MSFILIKTIHLFAAFIYGGFLITDNLFLNKMPRNLSTDEHQKARESFMMFVRKVVPPSLMVAVVTGLYLISQVFGEISGPVCMPKSAAVVTSTCTLSSTAACALARLANPTSHCRSKTCQM